VATTITNRTTSGDPVPLVVDGGCGRTGYTLGSRGTISTCSASRMKMMMKMVMVMVMRKRGGTATSSSGMRKQWRIHWIRWGMHRCRTREDGSRNRNAGGTSAV